MGTGEIVAEAAALEVVLVRVGTSGVLILELAPPLEGLAVALAPEPPLVGSAPPETLVAPEDP